MAPEILTTDKDYGTAEFVADVLDRGAMPHIPLVSGEKETPVPTYRRRTFDLSRQRRRAQKIRRGKACQTARAQYETRGYQVSRKLRVRSEHLFAECKNEHGLDRARRRGLDRVQTQMTLVALVPNLKRLAAHVGRGPRAAAGAALTGLKRPLSAPRGPHCRHQRVLHQVFGLLAAPCEAWSPTS